EEGGQRQFRKGDPARAAPMGLVQQVDQPAHHLGARIGALHRPELGHRQVQFLGGAHCGLRSSTRPAWLPVKACASQTGAPFTYTEWMPAARSMGCSKVAVSATVSGSNTTRSAK